MGSTKLFDCACGERIELSTSPMSTCPRCGRPVSARSGAPPSPTVDAELEHVLLKKGWTTLEKLQEARKKQAELSEQGRSASLADVLAGLQIVPPERLREAEALREKAPMKCPKCGKTYTVRGYRPGTRALCKSCKTALVPAGSITDVQPDDNGTDLQQVPVGEAIEPSMVDVIPGYQLERLLGAGGMGRVFLARQRSLDRLVAIKILSESLSQNSEYVGRFLTEARTAAKLNHENIVSAIDAGQSGSIHYFIMEYVEGETLQGLLQREGTLPERRALEIVRQVVTGLWQASQQGLIHRDIKPANIMITRTGMAKICDFGLARDVRSDTRVTQGSVVHSSPAYASPEQCKASPDLSFRSDMYSLGVTLFEMLTGELPFKSETPSSIFVQHVMTPAPSPRSVKPGLSSGANDLVLRLLRKEPEKRFKDYGELLSAIVAARQHSSAARDAGAAAGASPSAAGPARSRTAVWAVGGTIAAIALVTAVVAASRRGTEPPRPEPPRSTSEDAEAAALLQEARAAESSAKGKPSEYPRILSRWKRLVEQYRGTTYLNAFAGALVEFESRLAEEADRLSTEELREAAGLPAPEALARLRRFPKGLEDTPGARKVTQQVASLERAIEDRYQQGRDLVAGLMSAENFDEARKRLEELRNLVSGPTPSGPDYVKLSYRLELDAMKHQLEEQSLIARRRDLLAKEDGPAPKPPDSPKKEPAPDAAPATPAAAEPKPVSPELKPAPPVLPAPRLPVPGPSALKASEKVVRDLFKEEFTWKTPGEKNTLAKKLLELADQSRTDPAGRFVLLRESKDLSIAAGNPTLSLDTIDTMTREFEIDGLALKSAAYASLGLTVYAPEDIKEMAHSMLKLADAALAAENFEAAAKLTTTASALARRAKDIPLLSRAEAKLRDCDAWKTRSEKAKKAHEILQKKPEDPEACFIAGQYDCAIKGDWTGGLPLLARGSQPVLKALAQRDLAAPAEPAAQAALGDEWWDAGDRDGLLGKSESRRRAAYWYHQAISGLSGISRLKVEKRLSEAEDTGGLPSAKVPEPKGFRGPFELPDRGFIRQWLMIGPFPNTGDAGLDTDFLGGESKVVPAEGVESKGTSGVRRKWAPYASSEDRIDFFRVSHLGLAQDQPNLIVYAACWLSTESDQDLQIRLGSDDGCALWVDGQLIAKHHLHRALTIDGDTHAVRMVKGKHLILMKVENVTGSFQFILRVTTAAGERPSGLQVWN